MTAALLNLNTESKADRRKRHGRIAREREFEDEREQREVIDGLVEKNRLSERERLGEWLEEKVRRDEKRTVTFFVGGSMIEVSKEPHYELYEDAERGVRGKCSGFNSRCRQRMMEAGAKLLSHILPVMLTVTYGAWLNEPEIWKTHLNTLWKRIEREFDGASAIWKLEPQKRGAPHFHILVWGARRIEWQWLAVAWAEIIHQVFLPTNFPVAAGKVGAKRFREWADRVATTDAVAKSLTAGCRAEAVRSKKGAKSYLGKKYMGKEIELPEGWENPGRMWGLKGRAHLPRAGVVEWELGIAAAWRFRRLVRRRLGRGGGGGRNMGRLVLFSDATLEWARAVLWAQGLEYEARHVGYPLGAVPF